MKRAFAILFTLCYAFALSVPLLAQTRKVQYRPYIDERRMHYGFSIGMHIQDISLQNNGFVDPETGEQWYAQQDNHSPGFSVGVLGEYRLNKHFAIRCTPTLHFGQKHIKFYEQISGRDSAQTLKSAYISVPILVKFAAPRFNNFRPYLIAGIAPTFDLTARKHMALRTSPVDCMFEVGMGCDLYLPYFKLIPELKFSFGLADILVKKRSDLIDGTLMKYTKSLDCAHSRLVTLSFYFE